MADEKLHKTGLFEGAGSEPDGEWITVNGSHIFIKDGESKAEAIDAHFGKPKEDIPDNKSRKNGITEDISELLGTEFQGYKGQHAIDKLMQEKKGHIKAAFHREDIGDIDLLWGNDDIGLKHIVRRRTSEDLLTDEFLSVLTDTVVNGVLRESARGNFEILKDKHVAVVQPEFKGNKLNFVVTAYRTRKTSW